MKKGEGLQKRSQKLEEKKSKTGSLKVAVDLKQWQHLPLAHSNRPVWNAKQDMRWCEMCTEPTNWPEISWGATADRKWRATHSLPPLFSSNSKAHAELQTSWFSFTQWAVHLQKVIKRTQRTYRTSPHPNCPHSRCRSRTASGRARSGCSCSGTGKVRTFSHLCTNRKGQALQSDIKHFLSPGQSLSSPHSSLGSSEASLQSASASHFQSAGMQRPESLQRNSSTPHVIWAAMRRRTQALQ